MLAHFRYVGPLAWRTRIVLFDPATCALLHNIGITAWPQDTLDLNRNTSNDQTAVNRKVFVLNK